MLTKTDPLGAADIYCRFPVSETPTFDDAYIFGEIVRLLVKNDKLDDPRLETNLIALGKVMGLGKIPNTLSRTSFHACHISYLIIIIKNMYFQDH